MSVLNITKNNFKKEVLESEVPVLIDFWAPWCGPCRMVGPIIEEIGAETDTDTAKIGKINVDEEQELAAAFNVMSIPTLVVVKDGKIANSTVGFKGKEHIKSMLFKVK
jgi:thioredoxin 1